MQIFQNSNFHLKAYILSLPQNTLRLFAFKWEAHSFIVQEMIAK